MINNQKAQIKLNELAEERINLHWEKEENILYQRAERALDVLWRYHQFEILKREQICFNKRYYPHDKNPMRQMEVTLLDKVDTLHRFFIAHIGHERNRKKTHVEREADGYILQLNQWKNTKDVIDWFKNIKNKSRHKFVVFDVKDFYPSIKQSLLTKALEFARQHVRIKKIDYDTIMHARKSLLYCDKKPWMKKESGLFDVTMGAYDGA